MFVGHPRAEADALIEAQQRRSVVGGARPQSDDPHHELPGVSLAARFTPASAALSSRPIHAATMASEAVARSSIVASAPAIPRCITPTATSAVGVDAS